MPGSSARRRRIPYFNVKDQGAKGDGTTDDTAAIQRAHNLAMIAAGATPGAPWTRQAGTVYFPPGHYVSDNITWNAIGATEIRAKWIGEGLWGSIIRKKTPADGLPVLTLPAGSNHGLRLEGMHFDGNGFLGTAMTGPNVKMTDAGHTVFEACAFTYGTIGVDSIGSLVTQFRDCWFEGTATGAKFRRNSTSGNAANLINFDNTKMVTAIGTGIDYAEGGRLCVENSNFEGSTGPAIKTGVAYGQSASLEIHRSWFERHLTWAIDIGDDTATLLKLPVNIDGCYFLPGVGNSVGGGNVRIANRTGAVTLDRVTCEPFFGGSAVLLTANGTVASPVDVDRYTLNNATLSTGTFSALTTHRGPW